MVVMGCTTWADAARRASMSSRQSVVSQCASGAVTMISQRSVDFMSSLGIRRLPVGRLHADLGENRCRDRFASSFWAKAVVCLAFDVDAAQIAIEACRDVVAHLLGDRADPWGRTEDRAVEVDEFRVLS